MTSNPYEETLKILRKQREDLRACRDLRVSSREAAKTRIVEYTCEIDAATRLINSLDASITTLEGALHGPR